MNGLQTAQAEQYQDLTLPYRAPPSAVFGPVRAVLYVGICISYGYMAYKYSTAPSIPRWTSIFFVLNILANLSFTYVQFGLQEYGYAVALIVFIRITCIATIYRTWSKYTRVALAQIPYTLRVSFAGVLQYYVRILN